MRVYPKGIKQSQTKKLRKIIRVYPKGVKQPDVKKKKLKKIRSVIFRHTMFFIVKILLLIL